MFGITRQLKTAQQNADGDPPPGFLKGRTDLDFKANSKCNGGFKQARIGVLLFALIHLLVPKAAAQGKSTSA